MLKFEVTDEGYLKRVLVRGTPELIATQFASAICQVYGQLSLGDRESGKDFRRAMQTLMSKDSVCWDSSMHQYLGNSVYMRQDHPKSRRRKGKHRH